MTDTSPPVFPQPAMTGRALNLSEAKGMTLRDYFAGQVLPACLAIVNAEYDAGKMRGCVPLDIAITAARTAYQIADTMIVEGSK